MGRFCLAPMELAGKFFCGILAVARENFCESVEGIW
jgi:hypothetical protein